ncbi:uncharacterized protein F4812DRAFT_406910 [Daldinia caldariorum]|uniref:uncharacterized protein n=1 Tax=Daldinia caldariorum TaxID=326644 RepID=UPI002008D47E|nr:uncharacterized protein F4812DRAFT_406910 [Daldinia caldariorum]KAI1467727.1 hypothetical protein F4812DRAFT_406910 [Daldinia caldariorum]
MLATTRAANVTISRLRAIVMYFCLSGCQGAQADNHCSGILLMLIQSLPTRGEIIYSRRRLGFVQQYANSTDTIFWLG